MNVLEIGLKIMWKFWHSSVLIAKDSNLNEFYLTFSLVGFKHVNSNCQSFVD